MVNRSGSHGSGFRERVPGFLLLETKSINHFSGLFQLTFRIDNCQIDRSLSAAIENGCAANMVDFN